MVKIVSYADLIREENARADTRAQKERNRVKKHMGPRAGTGKGDGWRRLPEDTQLLDIVTRLGCMTVRQAQRYIYPTKAYSTVRRRISKMTAAGLLSKMDSIPWAGIIIWPTPSGRRAVLNPGDPLMSLTPPAESVALHKILVAEQALKIVANGGTIITEREIQRYEAGAALNDTTMRDRFLADFHLRDGTTGGAGVVPSIEYTDNGELKRYLTLPTPTAPRTKTRVPDLIQVTDNGMLRAIEVELQLKEDWRFRPILEGYRDACIQHAPISATQPARITDMKPIYHQFRNVHWVCSEPVLRVLRGYPTGVNPLTGSPDMGLVHDIWGQADTTRLFYTDRDKLKLEKTNYPISAELVDVSHDPGLEYAVAQRFLPVKYNVAMAQWSRWRTLWEKDMRGEDNPVGFIEWLRNPDTQKTLETHR